MLVSSPRRGPGGVLFGSGAAHACSRRRPCSGRWMHLRKFRCSKDSLAAPLRNLRWQAVARTWNSLTRNFRTSGEISFIFRALAISLDPREKFPRQDRLGPGCTHCLLVKCHRDIRKETAANPPLAIDTYLYYGFEWKRNDRSRSVSLECLCNSIYFTALDRDDGNYDSLEFIGRALSGTANFQSGDVRS